jgi:acetyltransferase-like isoleucine patch superfamily enzyme
MDDDLHQTFSKKSNNIIIENNVWIGANVFITKEVVIGTGSVIGAGTIVTKNLPSYSMVAGNPGKVIKENIIWK